MDTKFLNILGKGSFAKCYKVINEKTKEFMACKIIEQKNKSINEINIHKKLDHKNIVRFYYYEKRGGEYYIFMEYCSNGTLFDIFRYHGPFAEENCIFFTHEIVSGIGYLHSNRIIHRDLKLSNIFVNEKNVLKIGDFGLSTLKIPGEYKQTFCGTTNYMSPELISMSGYNEKIDVWAIGVIFYLLIFGKYPFSGTEKEMMVKIKKIEVSFSGPISEAGCLFLKEIFRYESERASIEKLSRSPLLKKSSGRPYSFFADSTASKSDRDCLSLKSEKNISCELSLTSNFRLYYDSLIFFFKNLERPMDIIKDSLIPLNGSGFIYVSDYYITKTYGIFYYMNSGLYGAFFNDKTKLIICGDYLSYYTSYSEKEAELIHISKLPSYLIKKYHVANGLKKYLIKSDSIADDNNKTWVTNFYKWNGCNIFSLSNNIIQFDFPDTSRILINRELFIYMNKDKYIEIEMLADNHKLDVELLVVEKIEERICKMLTFFESYIK